MRHAGTPLNQEEAFNKIYQKQNRGRYGLVMPHHTPEDTLVGYV
jgi:hypothetical protein